MVATMARRRQQRSINAKYDPLMRNTRSSSALFSVKRDPDPYPSQTRAGSAASRAALLEVLGLPEFAVSAGAGGGRSERQLRVCSSFEVGADVDEVRG